MGASYFVSPFRPPTWSGKTKILINSQKYADALELDWTATITSENLERPDFTLSWIIRENGNIILNGWLLPDGKVISIDGTAKSIADFAIWHWNFVHQDKPMYLFDEGLHIKFEINNSTNAVDIVDAINELQLN